MGSKNRIAKHLLPIMLDECEKHGITKWVEPFCLAKTTKVFTKDGIKALSDVEVGDYIYSDSCDLVKIVNKVDSCKTQGLKITLKGNVKIDTTEEHLFYLNNGEEVKAGDIHIGDVLLSGISSDKPNIVLDLAQFVTIKNDGLRGSRGGVVYEDYVKVYHNAPKVRRFVTVCEDFCWALGLVIAEGSKSSISLHKDEVDVANKFLDIYKKITGLEFENTDKFYFREDVKSLHVSIPSPKIYEALFFKACGIGYGARNKSMALGFEMSEKLVLKLIQGMHVGDGCTLLKGKYKSWNYKTSSETLAYQLQAILSTKLNIKSTLSQGINKERYIGDRLLKESNYFNISVNHSSDIATLEGVEVGNILQEKQKGFVVTNIEHSVNTYYDITLQDGSSHKFIIDGGIVTHNCGGANMIDKVPDSFERIGYDNNKYLIEMYKELQEHGIHRFKHDIPKDLYDKVRNFYNGKDLSLKYNDSYVGWVGFMASANGRFFDGGYSGVSQTKVGTHRNYIEESIKGLDRGLPLIKTVEFICDDYSNLDFDDCLIYCDPPYKGTKTYNTSKNFDHNKFYNWCREQAKHNVVFVSEYEAPEDFECVWSQEVKSSLSANGVAGGNKVSVEKLFKAVPNGN